MKSRIKNRVGDKSFNHYVPCTAANAQTLAENYLDGTWQVFEQKSKVGTDTTVTVAYDVNLQFEDTTTQKKGYLSFIAKSTLDETEIMNNLIGLTIDGITIDKVVIFNFAPLTFA